MNVEQAEAMVRRWLALPNAPQPLERERLAVLFDAIHRLPAEGRLPLARLLFPDRVSLPLTRDGHLRMDRLKKWLSEERCRVFRARKRGGQ